MSLTTFLAKIPAKVQAGVVIGVLALSAFGAWSLHERQVGALNAELRALRLEGKAAAETVKVRDVRYVRLRDTLRQVITRWDSVRVRDTLTAFVHDTAVVYVPRATADTAIRVCQRVVVDCEARVSARDALLANRDATIAVLKAHQPSTVGTVLKVGLGAAGGFLLGRVVR
jgi:hypothetical protein